MTRGLVKKTYYNTKIIEIENKAPSVIFLITTTAQQKAAKIENDIPDTRHFIKTN